MSERWQDNLKVFVGKSWAKTLKESFKADFKVGDRVRIDSDWLHRNGFGDMEVSATVAHVNDYGQPTRMKDVKVSGATDPNHPFVKTKIKDIEAADVPDQYLIKEALDVPQQHQLKIAKKTLQMNDVFARIMGGMSKDDARKFLKSIGWSDQKIASLEQGKAESKLRESAAGLKAAQMILKTVDKEGELIVGTTSTKTGKPINIRKEGDMYAVTMGWGSETSRLARQNLLDVLSDVLLAESKVMEGVEILPVQNKGGYDRFWPIKKDGVLVGFVSKMKSTRTDTNPYKAFVYKTPGDPQKGTEMLGVCFDADGKQKCIDAVVSGSGKGLEKFGQKVEAFGKPISGGKPAPAPKGTKPGTSVKEPEKQDGEGQDQADTGAEKELRASSALTPPGDDVGQDKKQDKSGLDKPGEEQKGDEGGDGKKAPPGAGGAAPKGANPQAVMNQPAPPPPATMPDPNQNPPVPQAAPQAPPPPAQPVAPAAAPQVPQAKPQAPAPAPQAAPQAAAPGAMPPKPQAAPAKPPVAGQPALPPQAAPEDPQKAAGKGELPAPTDTKQPGEDQPAKPGLPDPAKSPKGEQPPGKNPQPQQGQPQDPTQQQAPAQPGQQPPAQPGQQPQPGQPAQPGQPGQPGQAAPVQGAKVAQLLLRSEDEAAKAAAWLQSMNLQNVMVKGTEVFATTATPEDMMVVTRTAQAFGLEMRAVNSAGQAPAGPSPQVV